MGKDGAEIGRLRIVGGIGMLGRCCSHTNRYGTEHGGHADVVFVWGICAGCVVFLNWCKAGE